jgi:hypothetical protein
MVKFPIKKEKNEFPLFKRCQQGWLNHHQGMGQMPWIEGG